MDESRASGTRAPAPHELSCDSNLRACPRVGARDGYRERMPYLAWELLEETYSPDVASQGLTYRAAVRGGWLVAVWPGEPSPGVSPGLAFVPDAEHAWKTKARTNV